MNKMEEMVVALIKGSRNIDRMKSDIKVLLYSLIGLFRIDRGDVWPKKFSAEFVFDDEQHSWRVSSYTYPKDHRRDRITISLWSKTGIGDAWGSVMIATLGKEIQFFGKNPEAVLKTYEMLSVLIVNLFQKLPVLEEMCRPLIQASRFDLD